MSSRKQIIEIEPATGISREAFAMAPMKCPACNGRGLRRVYTEIEKLKRQ